MLGGADGPSMGDLVPTRVGRSGHCYDWSEGLSNISTTQGCPRLPQQIELDTSPQPDDGELFAGVARPHGTDAKHSSSPPVFYILCIVISTQTTVRSYIRLPCTSLTLNNVFG